MAVRQRAMAVRQRAMVVRPRAMAVRQRVKGGSGNQKLAAILENFAIFDHLNTTGHKELKISYRNLCFS